MKLHNISIILIAIIAVLFMFIGCNDKNPVTTITIIDTVYTIIDGTDTIHIDDSKKTSQYEQHNTFSFLKALNSWTYEYIYSFQNTATTYSFTIESMQYKAINFTKYALFHKRWFADNPMFYATDSTALPSNSSISYGTYNMVINPIFPLMWKDYIVGKKWNEKWGPEDWNIVVEREIISTNETVTVKAGTFDNCIKIKEIRSDAAVDDYVLWYVRNDIGIIKHEIWNPYTNAKTELVSKNF